MGHATFFARTHRTAISEHLANGKAFFDNFSLGVFALAELIHEAEVGHVNKGGYAYHEANEEAYSDVKLNEVSFV